ncbi:uracil-DNA glycosylase [Candidatus Bathyarchaeota archaeon]|nr:uracil-DNA glycosylase [Candidatus Bathyarchaeota archaeon]
MEELKKKAESCKKCDLWKNRKNVVFGEGSENAEIMIIGLGPGYYEDLYGKPFVGAAGKFLNKLLELANLKREEVYITNVVKCYLPNNKATEDQIKICASSYLNEQISLLTPKVIVALGNIAVNYLFNKFKLLVKPMKNIHGSFFKASSLFIIPMYHPASALRNPSLKTTLIEDWRKIKYIQKIFK